MEAEEHSLQCLLGQGRNKEWNERYFRIYWKWSHNTPKLMGHNESSAKREMPSTECLQKQPGESIYLTIHMKSLEQNEANTPKSSRCKEVIKLRGIINEIETRIIQRNNKSWNGFLEEINKIDMHLNNKAEGTKTVSKWTKSEMKREI